MRIGKPNINQRHIEFYIYSHTRTHSGRKTRKTLIFYPGSVWTAAASEWVRESIFVAFESKFQVKEPGLENLLIFCYYLVQNPNWNEYNDSERGNINQQLQMHIRFVNGVRGVQIHCIAICYNFAQTVFLPLLLLLLSTWIKTFWTPIFPLSHTHTLASSHTHTLTSPHSKSIFIHVREIKIHSFFRNPFS